MGFIALQVNKEVLKLILGVNFSDSLFEEHYTDVFITNIKSYYNNLKNNWTFNGYEKIPEIFYNNNFIDIMRLAFSYHQQKRIVIFFDEIFSVIKKQGALRGDVLEFLAQCRKNNILLITTAQEWSELPITWRRFVRYQIATSGVNIRLCPFAIVKNQVYNGDTIRWDSLSQDYIADIIQTNYKKGLKKVIQEYDTFETIHGEVALN